MEPQARKAGRGWWALAGIVAVSVVLSLALYVGAYYAMVKPDIAVWRGGLAKDKFRIVIEDYRWIDHKRGAWIFWPVHQIDKRFIRPAFWKQGPL